MDKMQAFNVAANEQRRAFESQNESWREAAKEKRDAAYAGFTDALSPFVQKREVSLLVYSPDIYAKVNAVIIQFMELMREIDEHGIFTVKYKDRFEELVPIKDELAAALRKEMGIPPDSKIVRP